MRLQKSFLDKQMNISKPPAIAHRSELNKKIVYKDAPMEMKKPDTIAKKTDYLRKGQGLIKETDPSVLQWKLQTKEQVAKAAAIRKAESAQEKRKIQEAAVARKPVQKERKHSDHSHALRLKYPHVATSQDLLKDPSAAEKLKDYKEIRDKVNFTKSR